MKSSTNLREAFLVFLSLTLMALCNTGLLWEGQKISQHYSNLELTQMLGFDESQLEKIRSIQAAYEIERAKVTRESTGSTPEKIKVLTRERNRQIMEVLSEHQKGILRAYCSNLVSFAKMSE